MLICEERLKRIVRNTLEIITLNELKEKIESGEKLKGYLGFEPSGLFHIGWIIWARKVQDLVDADIEMYLLEATWHAWINDKLGGDIEKIRRCARYIRYALEGLGISIDRIKFIDAEELVSDKDYWAIVLKAAKNLTLARVRRALTIMGRRADEAETDFSKLVYPLMQIADIFYLDLDIAVGGMDQRRAHVLARELAPKLGFKKPIAIHTPLLSGLLGPGRMEYKSNEEVILNVKMSKSKPGNAILIHDEPEVIREKIRRAYCPPRQTQFNPILEINKYILFAQDKFVLHIDRPEKYGGPLDIYSYDELEKLYVEGKLHPLDLKNATAEALIKYLEPVRKLFKENREAQYYLNEMLKTKITR